MPLVSSQSPSVTVPFFDTLTTTATASNVTTITTLAPPFSSCPTSLAAYSGTTALPLPPAMRSEAPMIMSPPESEEWQEWSGVGKYGSFLRMLNTPDLPTDSSREIPNHRFPPDTQTGRLPSRDCGLDQPASVLPGDEACVKDVTGQTSEIRKVKGSRRHQCPYCGFKCANYGQLRGHLRVHTGL
jgi:hypothetical protein